MSEHRVQLRRLGNVTADTTLWMSNRNPLRCRGYYYDSETGFYYLQSRYYDPVVKRFLNADSYASTGQGFLGYNMFAYCGNNPVNMVDSSGDMYVPSNLCDLMTDAGGKTGGNYSGGGGTGGCEFALITLIGGVVVIGEAIYYGGVFICDLIMSIVDSSYQMQTSSYSLSKTYDPDPYGRAGQKKQGRENKTKARKQDNWKPRNNRRDQKPRKTPKHTPGRDHRRFVFFPDRQQEGES